MENINAIEPSLVSPEIKFTANVVARRHGHGKATKIILGNTNRVVDHTPYGYRKYTTGQYVPKAYLSKFGWKNTYYQSAETIVEVDINQLND